MTPDPFFAKILKWSEYKHFILDKYLRMWVHKLASGHRRLAFVDTCAGAGRYDDEKPGSPVIAARWNEEFLAARGGRLIVHACEQDPENATQLREALRLWTSQTPPLALVYERPFFEVMPEILEATRPMPTFFFIDPYGLKDVTIDRLAPLLADRPRAATEVLLRADPTLLKRFAGWILNSGDGSNRRQRTAEGFKRLLARLNVDVVDIEMRRESGTSHLGGIDLFGQYLELIQQRFRYVQVIPIRPSYYAAPKYFLVHGTDSPDGAALINDAVSTTEDTLFGDTVMAADRATGQFSLLEPQRLPRFTKDQLALSVLSILSDAAGAIRYIELRAELAQRFGPDFRSKHHGQAVRELAAQGRLTVTPPGALKDGSQIRLVGGRVARRDDLPEHLR